MGGAAKSILSVVVAIAIPFVAPVVAGAFATSTLVSTLGMTASSALIGAGLGAANAAIFGNNIAKGALLGGIGGGIGGWASAAGGATAATTTVEGIASGTTDPVAALAAMSGAPVDATYISQIGLPEALAAAGATAGQTVLADGTVVLSAPTFSNAVTGAQTLVPMEAPRAAGDMLGTSSYAAPGLRTDPSVTGVNDIQAARTAQGIQPGMAAPAATPAAGPVSGTGAAAAGGSENLSFTQALARVPSQIAAKFTDPKALADLTLRAAGTLLTGAFAGNGLSPEEQELMDAQMEDLKRMRAQNEELFKTKLQEAMNLIGEAKYFDPEQYGLQAQAGVQTAGAVQQREAARAAALRPGGVGYTAADQRRAGLDVTARGATAYLQGAESGQKQRIATLQAGLNALPTSPEAAGLSASNTLMEQYRNARAEADRLSQAAGGWMGSITGGQKAGLLGAS